MQYLLTPRVRFRSTPFFSGGCIRRVLVSGSSVRLVKGWSRAARRRFVHDLVLPLSVIKHVRPLSLVPARTGRRRFVIPLTGLHVLSRNGRILRRPPGFLRSIAPGCSPHARSPTSTRSRGEPGWCCSTTVGAPRNNWIISYRRRSDFVDSGVGMERLQLRRGLSGSEVIRRTRRGPR